MAFFRFLALFNHQGEGVGELGTRIGVVEDWAGFEHWDLGVCFGL